VIHQVLEERLRTAVAGILPDADPAAIMVRPCPDPKFGDYQSASLIAMAKQRKTNPRQLATDVLSRLDVADWCAPPEIAGPGFLNFRLKPEALSRYLVEAARTGNLFYSKSAQPRTVVLDFSSPNVAKPMHVGHIRSTALGDTLGRTLRLLGHHVTTDNHIGDWGTQFGKLLVGWKQELDRKALQIDPLGEMERLYKLIHTRSETDPTILEAARQELVKLQNGDPENLALWEEMLRLSRAEFDRIYERLNIRFDVTLGESFYNPQLKDVVQDLLRSGLAQPSEGAVVVFFESIPELKDKPALIQKSDGAANYTTTDLATLAYRLTTWGPDEIIYVTDGRQQLHFTQLFEIFRRWRPESKVELAHVWFGKILGDDGRPFRTRSGDVIKLADLLDEAQERAYQVVTTRSPELTEEERREIARVVGIGSVKYADLLPNRQSDYVFSWDKMLALNGNTAPYLLYAYARTQSLFRKLESDLAGNPSAPSEPGVLSAPEEMTLGKHLLNFGLVLEAVAVEYRPNYLCNYLYELAGYFATFWEACPILKAAPPERAMRLALGRLTGQVLRMGLETLGLETRDRM
jgi:arginyl-tRNA synthetase